MPHKKPNVQIAKARVEINVFRYTLHSAAETRLDVTKENK
jgi:hypothetical protein